MDLLALTLGVQIIGSGIVAHHAPVVYIFLAPSSPCEPYDSADKGTSQPRQPMPETSQGA